MNFIFLMNPLETVNVKKDTTLMLMLASHQKGHRVYFLPQGGIVLKDNRVFFQTTEVLPQYDQQKPFMKKKSTILSQGEVDCVFIRTDPPFDEQYLLDTWLLDRLPKSVVVINSPNGIRTVNEKLWVTQFSNLIASTLVSRQKTEILDFLDTHQEVVLKPTDGYGGQSIFYLRHGEKNNHVIIETLTQRGQRYVIAQQYVPEAQDGDKRILLLAGDLLGAVLRLHPQDDHRNNFFAGGKPLPAQITKRDQQIIRTLKPALKKLGLYLVGIDIIGEYLIEVNVTSPTCLQEINRLYDTHLEMKVVAFAEGLVKDTKQRRK